ncbi:MAG TPA: hypothetical protein VHC22_24960 [Pirellulales bacterium]|nr:hypothetical protein [Pirellulales bacterium]
MRRPQFSVRTLLVAMLLVAAFFGGIHRGIHIGRQRQRDDDALAAKRKEMLATVRLHIDYLHYVRRDAEMQKPSEEAD